VSPAGLPGQSEKSFQAQVTHLALERGWRVYHTFRSVRSPAGFPDLVMVRRPRIVFAEVKREDGKTTAEQAAWLEDLAACGQESYLWRPSDWLTVCRVLL
jgi:hypothetical protein